MPADLDILYPFMESVVKTTYHPKIIFTSDAQRQIIQEPLIIIANHQQSADSPLVLTALSGNPICYLVAEKMFRWPILGSFLKQIDSIKIRQNAPQTEWFKTASQRLRSGCSVLIYPEGHQNKDGVMSKFQPGFLMLAAATGAPILPVYLSAQYRAFDEPVRVIIGEPVHLQNPSMNAQYIQRETERFEEIMLALQEYDSDDRKEEAYARIL